MDESMYFSTNMNDSQYIRKSNKYSLLNTDKHEIGGISTQILRFILMFVYVNIAISMLFNQTINLLNNESIEYPLIFGYLIFNYIVSRKLVHKYLN